MKKLVKCGLLKMLYKITLLISAVSISWPSVRCVLSRSPFIPFWNALLHSFTVPVQPPSLNPSKSFSEFQSGGCGRHSNTFNTCPRTKCFLGCWIPLYHCVGGGSNDAMLQLPHWLHECLLSLMNRAIGRVVFLTVKTKTLFGAKSSCSH